eukprot:353226-Chlamydomonas_euryale.AAC.4
MTAPAPAMGERPVKNVAPSLPVNVLFASCRDVSRIDSDRFDGILHTAAAATCRRLSARQLTAAATHGLSDDCSLTGASAHPSCTTLSPGAS